MKEDFFLIGYSNLYKNNNHKKWWTSWFIKKILTHKLIFSMIILIGLCFCMNFWLIYRFVNILQVYYGY